VVGLGAVALLWLYLSRGNDAGALEQDPGIPPPEYAYLDDARVVNYLGQIEGGLSGPETRSRKVTDTRTGGVAAGGVELGGSSSGEQSVTETVTPTTTAQFYRLLDRLSDKGYLRELNASSGQTAFAKALGAVPEGFFVRIAGCKLRVPTYVQMNEVISDSRGAISADRAWVTAVSGTDEEQMATKIAEAEASGAKAMTGIAQYQLTVQDERRLKRAATRFDAAIGANPPVPLASCTGKQLETRQKPDLLFPVGLDALTKERSLLAGPVTIVGKVVRQVRLPSDVYVDRKAVAAYSNAVFAMDDALGDFQGEASLGSELSEDVTVSPPGAVILPIAIYK
jgi:hypothetical protein